ncbi:PI-PLC X domain-containing protein 1 [Heterocephalus glaber]|uniref:PI-PLC X domain-containing protein 1 n=1 Tax=Heterocephalus glaber TaxID=10181 RepID=G5AT71_HETGA|nr:PI-PLC X domain-containing protein 1 [Heterocephalus glaber]
MLTEISERLQQHPRKVLVVACRNFKGLGEDLHEYLEVPTLLQLWASGQQVLLSYEDEATVARHPELWPGIPYWWGDQVKSQALIRYLETMKSCSRPVFQGPGLSAPGPGHLHFLHCGVHTEGTTGHCQSPVPGAAGVRHARERDVDVLGLYCSPPWALGRPWPRLGLTGHICVSRSSHAGGLFVAGTNLPESLGYILAHPAQSPAKLMLPALPSLSAWVREQSPRPGPSCTNIIAAGDFIGANTFVTDVIGLNRSCCRADGAGRVGTEWTQGQGPRPPPTASAAGPRVSRPRRPVTQVLQLRGAGCGGRSGTQPGPHGDPAGKAHRPGERTRWPAGVLG